jgi:hypothetical protein
MSLRRKRNSAVSAQIARDGATVPGSKGQPRAHPLIQVERALRDDVARGLERLSLLPRQRDAARSVREANAIVRRSNG